VTESITLRERKRGEGREAGEGLVCDTRTEGTVALQVHLDPWASNLWLIGGQLWVNVGRTSTNTQKTVVSSLKVLNMGWQGEGIKLKDTFHLKKRKKSLVLWISYDSGTENETTQNRPTDL